MTNLLEVVFESVSKNDVTQMVMTAISGAKKITDIKDSENFLSIHDDFLSEKGLDICVNFEDDISVLLCMHDFRIDNLVLKKVFLRLVKYSHQYDIEMSVDVDELIDVNIQTLIKHLHIYAKNIFKKYAINNFYCGLEPASDEETRYFTDDHLGPLM